MTGDWPWPNTAVTVCWISHFDLPTGASNGGIFTVKIDVSIVEIEMRLAEELIGLAGWAGACSSQSPFPTSDWRRSQFGIALSFFTEARPGIRFRRFVSRRATSNFSASPK